MPQIIRSATPEDIPRLVERLPLEAAGWQSKIRVLEAAGYKTAMVWSMKR